MTKVCDNTIHQLVQQLGEPVTDEKYFVRNLYIYIDHKSRKRWLIVAKNITIADKVMKEEHGVNVLLTSWVGCSIIFDWLRPGYSNLTRLCDPDAVQKIPQTLL